MINLFELTLFSRFKEYWKTMVSSIGTSNDIIPLIFAALPTTGGFGANQSAIASLFNGMQTGDAANRLNILLQYPTIKAHIPCITIEVQDEQEDDAVGSFIYEDTSQATANDFIGGVFTKRYSIGVYSEKADTTLYLFAFLKYMLMDIRGTMDPASLEFYTRKMEVDMSNRFEMPIFFRYVDITAPGIIDSVDKTYDKVTSVTVSDQEVINNLTSVSI